MQEFIITALFMGLIFIIFPLCLYLRFESEKRTEQKNLERASEFFCFLKPDDLRKMEKVDIPFIKEVEIGSFGILIFFKHGWIEISYGEVYSSLENQKDEVKFLRRFEEVALKAMKEQEEEKRKELEDFLGE